MSIHQTPNVFTHFSTNTPHRKLRIRKGNLEFRTALLHRKISIALKEKDFAYWHIL
jgi:hypothetical protein